MTNPFEAGQPPAKKKIFNPAMLIGIAVVAVLAIAVVIVAVTRDGGDDDAAASSSSESSAEATPSGTPDGGTVTNEEFGLAYDFPLTDDPFEESKWAGPTDVMFGELSLASSVGYESCTPDAGVDILFGLLASDESDLATAAQSMYETAATNVVTDGEDVSTGSATSVTVDSGLEGELYEGEVTRSSADECGNTKIHVVALAVENEAGDTVIMLGSLRLDGDSVASGDELIDVTVAAMKSLRTV